MRIGIIGCGNMGEIFLKSIISAKISRINSIIVSDKDNKKLEYIRKKYNIKTVDNLELVKLVDIIIIAVKPQDIALLLKQISGGITSSNLVISIAAGIKLSFIQKFLKDKVPVIRIMPNVACLVKEGISAISKGEFVNSEHIKLAKKILSQSGAVIEVEEKFMDIITAISGSGPGYISYIVDSLIRESVEQGLDKTTATRLVLKTLIGTGQLLKKTGMKPDELIKKVTSKGGTTEAALSVFDKKKVAFIIKEAVKAATSRSKQLSKR